MSAELTRTGTEPQPSNLILREPCQDTLDRLDERAALLFDLARAAHQQLSAVKPFWKSMRAD